MTRGRRYTNASASESHRHHPSHQPHLHHQPAHAAGPNTMQHFTQPHHAHSHPHPLVQPRQPQIQTHEHSQWQSHAQHSQSYIPRRVSYAPPFPASPSTQAPPPSHHGVDHPAGITHWTMQHSAPPPFVPPFPDPHLPLRPQPHNVSHAPSPGATGPAAHTKQGPATYPNSIVNPHQHQYLKPSIQPDLITAGANLPPTQAQPAMPMPMPGTPGFTVRSHPHLPSSILYITSIPPQVDEIIFAEALSECMPIKVKMEVVVPEEHRLKPNAFYDWMRKTGTIQFQNTYALEKALAILPSHPVMMTHGINVSPYPAPLLLPTPPIPSPARYIHPVSLLAPPPPPPPSMPPLTDPQAAYIRICPTPGEIFDCVRPWGAIRLIGVWLDEVKAVSGQPGETHEWRARVEFWHEDEAKRFEHGFGMNGLLLKGWRISVFSQTTFQSVEISAAQAPYPIPMTPPTQAKPLDDTLIYPMGAAAVQAFQPPVFPGIAMPNTPPYLMLQLPLPEPPHEAGLPLPTTTIMPFTPPWNAHQTGTVPLETPSPIALSRRRPSATPSTPRAPGHGRGLSSKRSSANLHASGLGNSLASSLGHNRNRTWSLTLDAMPDGGLKPTGLIAMDGSNMFIPHGPGQHIRPAPAWGPGSTSASGLVDYANIFVKNLDSDINSYYLTDMFSSLGRIISARVMRDESGASRGYGFVSFHSPEEAAHAIEVMNGKKVGGQVISVTLHEPRKVRPEKLAERRVSITPLAYGRSSTMSRRSSTLSLGESFSRHRERSQSTDLKASIAVNDEIRLLSPSSRKAALEQRISARVKLYARVNDMTDTLAEEAIQSLVADDLALVPLLYDSTAMQVRIAEAFLELNTEARHNSAKKHSDSTETTTTPGNAAAPQDNQEERTIAPQDRTLPALNLVPLSFFPIDNTASATKDEDSRKAIQLSDQEYQQLHHEIARIDPEHADQVIQAMLENLDVSALRDCWRVRDTLARQYGVIKRRLADLQAKTVVINQARVSADTPTDTALDHATPEADSGINTSSGEVPVVPVLPLADLTVDKLIAQPPASILSHLRSPHPDGDIFSKLGITRPSANEVSNHQLWLGKLRRKSLGDQKADIAAQFAKRLSAGSLKRSQKVKIAMDIVTASGDPDAMADLLLFPEILDAMVKSYSDSSS